MELKFFKCNICHKVITMVNPTNVDTICCGQKMEEIRPNTTDGAVEKHVPVVEIKDNKVIVSIGSEAHPMVPEHYIQWIALHTNLGTQIKYLKPNNQPKICFKLCDNEQVIATYAYCNIHGLWKK